MYDSDLKFSENHCNNTLSRPNMTLGELLVDGNDIQRGQYHPSPQRRKLSPVKLLAQANS